MSLPYFSQSVPDASRGEHPAAYGDSFVERGKSASAIRQAIDRRGLQSLLAGTVACVLIAGGAFVQVLVRTRVTESGYELSKLAGEHNRLLRERERLTLVAGQLSAPARLEELARSRLSMGPPPVERTVVLVRTAPVEERAGREAALALGEKKHRK